MRSTGTVTRSIAGCSKTFLDAQYPHIDGKSGDDRRLLGRLIATWDYCVADHDKTAHTMANPVEPEKETEDDSPWPEDRDKA